MTRFDQNDKAGKPSESTDGVQVYRSINRLENWVNGHYEGWDPYDGINSDKIVNAGWDNIVLKMGLIQLHRLSPINLREFFGVKKGISSKGLAVFIQAYLVLYSATGREEYLKEATKLSEVIIGNSLIDKYGDHAWASHYYTYVSVDGIEYPPSNADTIGTLNVLKALSMLHQVTGEDRLEEIIGSCQSFFQKIIEKKDDVTYVLYGPEIKNKIVPNASAESLAAIALSFKSRWNGELHEKCNDVLRSLLHQQREDGSWVYSIYSNGMEYNQMDFHQGYMIGGLLAYKEFAPPDLQDDVEGAIAGAITSYKGLFRADGRGVYRAPRKNPADIHNQAQGIISFTQAGEFCNDPSLIQMADRIADWTITQMQDRDGYFYCTKGLLITNKIPYMRWGQAWMYLALATLLAHKVKYDGFRIDRP